MTATEFNNKYSQWLEKGHYGLDIDHPKVIKFLDEIFQDLIKIPDFQFTQIKTKFNFICFYSSLSISLNSIIEQRILKILEDDPEITF